MHDLFFTQLNSNNLAELINNASSSVCYAAPGIQAGPAQALIKLAENLGKELITVFLDVDENVIRMGYGELAAIKALHQASIRVEHIAGLRNGLIVVDGQGFSYTPIALFLERETNSSEALNAMRLTPGQASEAMARLSPASRAIAIAQAATPERKQAIEAAISQTSPVPLNEYLVNTISEKLKAAPPVKFDIARQVRVFQPYFQYVELSLTGAAIQKHKLAIPKVIQNLGSEKELEGRLKTTFDLIDKDTSVSSKVLDAELRDIRNSLTRSLGKQHGRIIRKAALPRLELRLDGLRKKIESHQEVIKKDLESILGKSKALMVSHYLPVITENVPDELYGIFGHPTDEDIKAWLDGVLSKAFPNAEDLISNIRLEVNYKDVTFDTLNRSDFLTSIQEAYPDLDWKRTYAEFRAAGENSEE